ncbi:MAG TPA: tRNA (N(6)-L-threonylcarbamoyladenosine(37)-C(2))-methylthiotransferase MtaB [Porphyromonadaceae bacterium]|nr:tRNA (N(6)-L-threonylcarbamoyladenosine(37)-C(2))-methylthiotransferase MtaB [Paramuribaculum sp.]HAB41791.1 tRNA (N(6)-L-threonylcarbamoyladenosine(37)-C(2))-methylthiotransferase MtaB [Porphyromonadaceae bacterium]
MIDKSTFSDRKALFHTFGCKLNFAETSTVAKMLAERGIIRAREDETPDIIVVNTCSVTELADKKCRQTIRAFNRRYPRAAIVVTGCYAQLKAPDIENMPGVVIVAGNDRKLEIADAVERWLDRRESVVLHTPVKDIRSFSPSCARGDRTRFFLKVQDGCDYFCSYCTIPYARGRSRSATIDTLVAQASGAAAEGGREIVITGVNIGDFGKGRSDTFFDLMRALDQVEGIERYRISSIEPNLLTDEMIEWVAGSRAFMPHFHIPLQSGSDAVLQLMRRRYGTSVFRHRVETIREVMPYAFIGVDLIVGARGETPEEFAASRDFVDSLAISRLHVFPYSERPGTRALTDIDHVVSQHDKHLRAHTMLDISDRKLKEFTDSFIGTVRPVLVEHRAKGDTMGGFTDNYLRVSLPADASLDNRIVPVRLLENLGEEIRGEVVG